MSQRKSRLGGWGFLIVPLAIVILVGLLFLGMDQLCVNDANRRLPRYPGAVRIEEQHNGLRLRGIGNGLEVLATEDSPETVTAWYEVKALELVTSGRPRGLNSLSHWLEPAPAGGSRIVYLSQCVM